MTSIETKHLWNLLPKFKSNKVLHASKIKNIEIISSIGNTPICGYITLMEPQGVTVRVDAAFLQKHRPDTGGYLLGYEEGYLSYLPEEPFEDIFKYIADA